MEPGRSGVKFGLTLPTYIEDDGGWSPADLARYARTAEDAGFDSLWLTDHLLRPPAMHEHAFLEPLTVLGFLSACTTRVSLGTAVLVLPLHRPVMLAKQLASLSWLSTDRIVLGVGTGWSHDEFRAVGVDPRQRGKVTDEVLSELQRLLVVERAGTPHEESMPRIEPAPRHPLPMWVGGGGQVPAEGSVERAVLAPAVRRRIASADGWLSRPTSTLEQLESHWGEIRTALLDGGHDPDHFTFAHKCYVHVSQERSEDGAIREQAAALAGVAGPPGQDGSFAKRVHPMGRVEELREHLRARLELGVNHLILSPATRDLAQIQAIAELIAPLRGGPNA